MDSVRSRSLSRGEQGVVVDANPTCTSIENSRSGTLQSRWTWCLKALVSLLALAVLTVIATQVTTNANMQVFKVTTSPSERLPVKNKSTLGRRIAITHTISHPSNGRVDQGFKLKLRQPRRSDNARPTNSVSRENVIIQPGEERALPENSGGSSSRPQTSEELRLQQDEQLAAVKYKSYDDYVQHQRSKLSIRLDKIRRIDSLQRLEYTKYLTELDMFRGKNVLCLGARLGGEVQAFRSAGALAIGIDLEPGEGNQYVLTGDFHNIQFGNHLFDYVFTNVLDHAFDLGALRSEICRVLKPRGGVFLVDYVAPDPARVKVAKQGNVWESLDDSNMEVLFQRMKMRLVDLKPWVLKASKGKEQPRVSAFLECE